MFTLAFKICKSHDSITNSIKSVWFGELNGRFAPPQMEISISFVSGIAPRTSNGAKNNVRIVDRRYERDGVGIGFVTVESPTKNL